MLKFVFSLAPGVDVINKFKSSVATLLCNSAVLLVKTSPPVTFVSQSECFIS